MPRQVGGRADPPLNPGILWNMGIRHKIQVGKRRNWPQRDDDEIHRSPEPDCGVRPANPIYFIMFHSTDLLCHPDRHGHEKKPTTNGPQPAIHAPTPHPHGVQHEFCGGVGQPCTATQRICRQGQPVITHGCRTKAGRACNVNYLCEAIRPRVATCDNRWLPP